MQTVKVYAVKREWGVNPLRYLSVCASKGLYPSAKAGHWETEKAGYKSAGRLAYMVRVTRPALVVSRTCPGHRETVFVCACLLVRAFAFVQTNCEHHRKTQLW